jgi:hypothetical protein
MADHDRNARGNSDDLWTGWVRRRREKMIEEIARNRRGENRVPTWVLVVLLVAIVGGWTALVLLS